MPPHHRNQGPHTNSKTPAGKRMPLENISNTVGYHDIRKYFYEISILPYFRKFSHSKITTYTVNSYSFHQYNLVLITIYVAIS